MAFQEPKRWMEWLALAEWWYNSSYHTSLKTTPFQALYGFPPPQINEMAIPSSVTPQVQGMLAEKGNKLRQLKENLCAAQGRIKHFADLKRTEREFHIGDMVYLKMQPYRQVALGLRQSLKLTTKHYGPYRVMEDWKGSL